MSGPQDNRIVVARRYLEIDQPQRALAVLDTGEIDLEEVEPWAIRAGALHRLERYEEGAEAARAGLALSPHSVELLDGLALNELELGHLAAAERALLTALDVAPEDTVLLCHYALACAYDGQFDKAGRLLDKAGRLDPLQPAVLETRGWIAYMRGDTNEAERAVARLLAADPESRAARVLQGNLAVEDRDVRGAARQFEAAARLDPSDRDVVRVTRHNRALIHPVQWPVYPILRFGPWKVWAVYVVAIFLLWGTGLQWLATILVVLYLFMVGYSWTVAPLAQRWLQRRPR